MKLGETVIDSCLKGVYLCGSITVVVCASSSFGRKAGSEASTGHISPQNVLEVTIVGS